ncbi:MAG: hypothetical protein ACRD0O_11880, partial [Acidimicrobiia bacterium]
MAVSETTKTNGRGRATQARPAREQEESYGPGDSGALGAGARAMEILAPEGGLAVLDPVSFGKAISRLGNEVARRPVPTLRAVSRLGAGLALTGMAAAGRAAGIKTPPA